MEHNFGFIGLGAMGYPMAINIRRKMPPNGVFYVTDADPKVAESFQHEAQTYGPVKVCSSAREVAENALTIITILPSAAIVQRVYLDETTGIIAAKETEKDTDANTQRLYLECSTIDVATATSVGKTLHDSGMGTYIDSPVSGGVPAAQRGDLSFLLGAAQEEGPGSSDSQQIAARIKTTSHYMGSPDKIFYCGHLGSGLAAKICNNYLSCTILLATSEAMATGIKLGLDKHLLHEVIHNSTGQSFMADNVCPVPGVVEHAPSSHNYRLGFKAQMLAKDVQLGVDAANSVGIKPSIGEAAMEVYKKVAVDENCIDRDASVVYRFLGGPE